MDLPEKHPNLLGLYVEGADRGIGQLFDQSPLLFIRTAFKQSHIKDWHNGEL